MSPRVTTKTTTHADVAKARREAGRVGAFIPRDQRRQLIELARREDRSLSAILRRALAAELEREGVHDE